MQLHTSSTSSWSSRTSLSMVVAIVLTLSGQFPSVYGYIVNKSALPTSRQIEYLKKITGEIVNAPIGELSDEKINDSHHVMKGWQKLSKSAAAVTSSANAGTSNRQKRAAPVVAASKENAVAVENLVKRLVDEATAGNVKANPTTEDYNCMLESWARSGEGVFAAERCEAILTSMQEQYEAGNTQVQPNLASFKISLMAWKHAGGDSLSSFRAQRILEWMVSLYQQGKNDLAFPDQMSFDTVLQSWSRNNHKRAPEFAESLLGTMEKLSVATESPRIRPRTLSFNAVLGAWGRAPSEASASKPWQRACDILSFMEKLYYVEGNQQVQPDRVSYQIVMGALARSGDPSAAIKADKILKFVEKQHKAGDLGWKPDTLLFNSALGCWAHSNKKDAYRKAKSILDRQIYHFTNGCENCRPDVVGFTSVLSACASEPGDETTKAKAFNVAASTFRQLVQNQDDFGSPNHVTYGTMLKCVARLLPHGSSERKRWTKKLFRECCSKGMVGGMVLSRMREAAGSADEYRHLMKGNTKGSLPKKWTQNVHEKNEFRRRAIGKRGEV